MSVSSDPSPPIRINAPLFKLKILDALKDNDFDRLVTLVSRVKTTTNADELILVKNLILNLAVQVASVKFIQRLLKQVDTDLTIDINYQDVDGNTPLHLVAINNRLDVAQILLKNDRINDTILNNDGKQPIELTNDVNMILLFQQERTKYIEKVANQFKTAFATHDFATLDEIYSIPRNFELLDINGHDPETGDTVLHEFIKKNDIGMVKWILSHGGDPFKRDKKGRLPIEVVGKQNETMKQVLKDASQDQSVINTSNASARIGGIQVPVYKGYLRKWTNFASGYKLRWFILDSNGILSYYINQEDTNNACRGSLNMKSALLHLDSSEKLKFEIISKSGIRWHLKGNHPIETNRWVWSLQGAIRFAKDKEKSRRLAIEEANRSEGYDPRLGHKKTLSTTSSVNTPYEDPLPKNILKNGRPVVQHPHIINDSDDEDDDEDDDDTDVDLTKEYDITIEREDIETDSGPFVQEIAVLKSRFSIELNSLSELLADLKKSGIENESLDISLRTLDSLVQGFVNYNKYVSKRDEKLVRNLHKQRDINELWINSIRELENELIAKNSELETFENERKKIRKALNRRATITSTSTSAPVGLDEPTSPTTVTSVPTSNADEEISRILHEDEESEDEFFDADEFDEDEDEIVQSTEILEETPSETETISDSNENETEESEIDFEYHNDLQKQKDKLLREEGSFVGYEDPVRTDLPLKVDDRPKISLWGILKSMIGKDITKIALPVSFNEPTSMLQRVAEDLEYSSLLDQAASFEDSTLRMLYVAVFAASEYSSTINRVAKPFNPLLGETYEYSRPDKGFRFLTEQVSHHPPVSAILAESPKWDYYGETPVKSGFNGRSFDVQPLATWYLHLRPDDSNEEEIYSWKKVTSSVIGIMVGNPAIDNFGEMVITNNRTGDKCVVTFKPRGWRSTSAYELSGVVTDKDGNKTWALGGHWDSKIFGKRVVNKNEVDIDSTRKGESSHPTDDGSKFLMWTPTPRPSVPFNLTSYAISLNAPQPRLLEWLSKSDTRLRPDQRAMENGKYDDASELKERVENKQRAARKQREIDGVLYRPTFFTRETHPITGEEYWKYNGDYWKLRVQKELPDIDIF